MSKSEMIASETKLEKRIKSISKRIPFAYKILFTPEHKHKCLKRTVGIVTGFILGLMFYEFVLADLSFSEDMSLILGAIVCIMMAFGIAFSSQIRCITVLTFPSFGGKVGKGVLKALVINYVIAGPVENIANNGKEVVRVFACTASLTYNLTKTRFELMFKPFTQAIFGMKTDVNEVKDTLRSIKDVSSPIVGEIEDEAEMRRIKEENDYLDEKLGDSKRSESMETKYKTKGEKTEAKKFEEQYIQKIEMRCEDQFTKASKKCRKMFESGYNKCYDTVTWVAAWLICWPMKLDFVCNIAEALGGSSRCDPSKDIDPGFGEGYSYLKKSRSSVAQNFKDVRVQYKIGRIKQLRDVRDARDTAVAILHDVKEKKTLLNSILNIIKRLLAFIFLRIILDAQNYQDKYLRDLEFDNFYITRYFRKIDARRKLQDKATLLPLKKVEKQKLVDPVAMMPLKEERAKLKSACLILFVEMITATTFVLLDRLFYLALDIVRRHSKINYLQTGKHDLYLEIKGTGMIASLLRSIVKGFNVKKRIRIERSNEKCLPQPQFLPYKYYFKIYGVYLGILLMTFAQAYTLRLRRVICSYFYHKREKKRVLFLYNETVKRRKGFFSFMKKKVEKQAREHRLKENYNVFKILRINHPKQCDWLRFFACARRCCLICEEPEPRKNSTFVECPNEFCYFIYCKECWTDVGNKCLACDAEAKDYGADHSSVESLDYEDM